LINNFKLATELGAEIIKVESKNIPNTIVEEALKNKMTTICIGRPHFTLLKSILSNSVFDQLLIKLTGTHIDLVILS